MRYRVGYTVNPYRKEIMETQTSVLYEVTVPETNRVFFTTNREEALDYYRDNHMVFEIHKTISQPMLHTQTITLVILQWNNNPEFEDAYTNR